MNVESRRRRVYVRHRPLHRDLPTHWTIHNLRVTQCVTAHTLRSSDQQLLQEVVDLSLIHI